MPRRPNIVLTVADDQQADAVAALSRGEAGRELQTPHLDSLCERGVAMSDAHHMGSLVPAVCAPSRAMLHTGRSLWRVQPQDLTDPATGRVLPTLGGLLREAGYDTFGVGKWHNGRDSFAHSFDAGSRLFFGGMDDPWATAMQDYQGGSFGESYTGDGHATDLFADAACEYLRDRAEGDDRRPLFLYVAFTSPHDPRTAPAKYHDLYDTSQIMLPENVVPEHPFDNGELHVRDENLEPAPRTREAVRQHSADYFAMVTHLDDALGRVHAALDTAGLTRDTLVIHTADHGLSLGRHGLMGKQNLYNESWRVPLILAGPGVPEGERRAGLCYQHDLFPTLLEAAGVDVPEATAFRSLWPMMRGQSDGWMSVFGAYRDVQRAVRGGVRGGRVGRWKLIEYLPPAERRTQLFDLRDDPLETRNLADASAHADTLARLRDELRAWQGEVGDPVQSAATIG